MNLQSIQPVIILWRPVIYNDNELKGPLTPNQGDYSLRPFPTDFGRIFSFIWIIVCFSTIIGIYYWNMTSVIYSIFSHIDWPSTRFHSDISNRISVNAILFLWNMQMHAVLVHYILFFLWAAEIKFSTVRSQFFF